MSLPAQLIASTASFKLKQWTILTVISNFSACQEMKALIKPINVMGKNLLKLLTVSSSLQFLQIILRIQHTLPKLKSVQPRLGKSQNKVQLVVTKQRLFGHQGQSAIWGSGRRPKRMSDSNFWRRQYRNFSVLPGLGDMYRLQTGSLYFRHL